MMKPGHQKLPISAIVLTYNSARTLNDVLRSVCWCEEILVVDSGSQDETLQIAETFGARVLHRNFDGYGTQKRYAVSLATHDWVFVVDSDEVVTHHLHKEITSLFADGYPEVHGYYIPIKLVFLGYILKFSGHRKKFYLRLFNKRYGNFNLALVHESVELKGKINFLQHPIWHYSYLTLDDYFQKFNRYTTFGAKDLYDQKQVLGSFKVWFSFQFHFIRTYIFKLGFLDGYYGFLWCLFSAFYPVAKYAKLAEMNKMSEMFGERA
jgi:glycosyltransferase involved in cell wall biosynthesis